MLAREQPDIVSVATQPEHRAEIVIYAADHGARAIYAEKPFAPVAGRRRRDGGRRRAQRRRLQHGHQPAVGPRLRRHQRRLIDSGEIGDLKAVIIYDASTLFNMTSHWLDIALRLNDDKPVAWVQGTLLDDSMVDGDRLREEPSAHGIAQFEDGVTVYVLQTARQAELEAVCERGVVTTMNGKTWQLRSGGEPDHRGRSALKPATFPAFQGGRLHRRPDRRHRARPRHGRARPAAASASPGRNAELIFGFIESHLRGGARVPMPLARPPPNPPPRPRPPPAHLRARRAIGHADLQLPGSLS